jgi:hypothetical protein
LQLLFPWVIGFYQQASLLLENALIQLSACRVAKRLINDANEHFRRRVGQEEEVTARQLALT